MTKNNRNTKIPDNILMSKILFIRGRKVMIDRDLAELYGVSTKRLNEQVKRNLDRFTIDFMYQLTLKKKWRWSQIATTLTPFLLKEF